MADLSWLSDADLTALKSGDLSKVSDSGLTRLRSGAEPKAPPTMAQKIAANPVMRFALGAASPVLGAAQLAARNPIGKYLGQDKWVDDKLQTLEEMKKAGGHEGFDWMGLAGAVATPGLVAARLPLAATTAGRVGQGAMVGAGAGATTPATEGDFLTAKAQQVGIGAALGPLGPAVVASGSKGAGLVRNVVDPWLPGGVERLERRQLSKAAGDKREEIMRLLEENKQHVPGSQAGAGEVAAPAGRAEFSALQRLSEPQHPSDYLDMELAQNAARVAAVRTVSKDKPTLESAISRRGTDAGTNYEKAWNQSIRGDPELSELSKNPYFRDALPDAIKLAKSNMVNPRDNLTQLLHYVKLSLDKQVGRTGDTALSKTERESVQATRESLIDWMGKKNPSYESARADFAAQSKPINQMQVGQYLENKLVSPLTDVGGPDKQRAALYAAGLRDAPGTIKRSIGGPRFENLTDVLNPKQVDTLNSVGMDLGRRAQYETQAQKGLPAAKEIVGLPEVPPTGMFNPVISTARAIINRFQGKLSDATLKQLALDMKDPQEVARIMSKLPPADRKAVIEEILQRGALGSTAAASAGIAQQY